MIEWRGSDGRARGRGEPNSVSFVILDDPIFVGGPPEARVRVEVLLLGIVDAVCTNELEKKGLSHLPTNTNTHTQNTDNTHKNHTKINLKKNHEKQKVLPYLK